MLEGLILPFCDYYRDSVFFIFRMVLIEVPLIFEILANDNPFLINVISFWYWVLYSSSVFR